MDICGRDKEHEVTGTDTVVMNIIYSQRKRLIENWKKKRNTSVSYRTRSGSERGYCGSTDVWALYIIIEEQKRVEVCLEHYEMTSNDPGE